MWFPKSWFVSSLLWIEYLVYASYDDQFLHMYSSKLLSILAGDIWSSCLISSVWLASDRCGCLDCILQYRLLSESDDTVEIKYPRSRPTQIFTIVYDLGLFFPWRLHQLADIYLLWLHFRKNMTCGIFLLQFSQLQ